MKKNKANRTCFISPHSDDIAMSCFQIIKKQILSSDQFLLTVFGVSGYVEKTKKYLYRTRKDVAYIRLREDKKFSDFMDMHFNYFKIPDCFKRHKKVFFDKTDLNLDKKLLKVIVRKLTKFILNNNITQVVVHYPYGAKQHFDHRLILEVAQRLSNVELFYVDDIPYSCIGNNTGLKLFKEIKINQKDLQKKHEIMEIYSSQMCPLFHRQVNKITNQNKKRERIFKNEKGDNCDSDIQ